MPVLLRSKASIAQMFSSRSEVELRFEVGRMSSMQAGAVYRAKLYARPVQRQFAAEMVVRRSAVSAPSDHSCGREHSSHGLGLAQNSNPAGLHDMALEPC